MAVTRAPPQGSRSVSDRRTHGARLDAADTSFNPQRIDIPSARAQKCMKHVRVPVVRQMTIFERQLILLPAVTPQTELVHPTQFDYDRHAHVRASARRARPAKRARCRGTHCAPHPIPHRQPRCTCVACGRDGPCPCAQGSSSTCRRSACRRAWCAASSRRRGERPRRSRCSTGSCGRCGLWPSRSSCARCGGRSPPAPAGRVSCAPRRARRCAGGTAERRMWPTFVRAGVHVCDTRHRMMQVINTCG